MVSMTLVMVFGRKSILLTPALFRQSTGTLWATQSQEIVRSTPVRHKQLTPLLQYVLSLTSTPRITDAFLPCLSPDSPPGPVHRLSYGRKTQNIQIPQSWKVGHHAMLLVIYIEFDEARASMIAHRELQHRAASLGESQMMKRCLFGCRWPSFRFNVHRSLSHFNSPLGVEALSCSLGWLKSRQKLKRLARILPAHCFLEAF